MDPLGRELHPPACFSPPPLPPVPEREHMFEKVVTPSDVGKLNRLVVPKQQAERFFPLEPRLAVKGLFLTFDDLRRRGKRWCFRYSYWHSSQSYVITRGWSRFVRETRLAAGDTVSFSRAKAASAAGGEGRGEEYCLFIDTQHRRKMHHKLQLPPTPPPPPPPPSFPNAALLSAYTCQLPLIGIVQRLDAISAGMPTVAEAAKPRQVRLFGVNLDCPDPGNSFSSL